MLRRPKGAKYSFNPDQVRRSVATSTAIETGEPSGTVEERLKANNRSGELENSEASKDMAQAQPNHTTDLAPIRWIT